MRNRIHFLSGLPRSGSTLLGSILNQNPSIRATSTSPLQNLLAQTIDALNKARVQYVFDLPGAGDTICRGLVEAFHPWVRERPVVFDKHRLWPQCVPAIIQFVDSDPRIVCTMRPIAEIITSYIVLAEKDPDNFIDRHLKRDGQEITNEARAYILWTKYLNYPYQATLSGLENFSDNLLLVDYHDLVLHPRLVLDRIYDFCGMDYFEHDFGHIENTCCAENDDAWGMKNLHVIRSQLGIQSNHPLTCIPQVAIDYFSQFDLWKGKTCQTTQSPATQRLSSLRTTEAT